MTTGGGFYFIFLDVTDYVYKLHQQHIKPTGETLVAMSHILGNPTSMLKHDEEGFALLATLKHMLLAIFSCHPHPLPAANLLRCSKHGQSFFEVFTLPHVFLEESW